MEKRKEHLRLIKQTSQSAIFIIFIIIFINIIIFVMVDIID